MQQEELGRLPHWLLAFVGICWAVAIFSGRGHLALCLRGVRGLNVFVGHCTSAHCWNFFYYKISVSCLWAPPALFIIQASSGSSDLWAPGKRWAAGRLPGPLMCLASPCWTSRAQQENTWGPLEPLSSVSKLPLWCCHVALMTYWTKGLTKELQIFLGYSLRSKSQAGLTLAFPHKPEDFSTPASSPLPEGHSWLGG